MFFHETELKVLPEKVKAVQNFGYFFLNSKIKETFYKKAEKLESYS